MCTERIYIDIYVISNNVNNIVHSANKYVIYVLLYNVIEIKLKLIKFYDNHI